MRYAFFGTPRFAAIILEKLIAGGIPPALIVTNPDRPAGRKKILTPPPAKLITSAHNIPIYQPEKLEIENWELEINKLGGIDLAVVAAYGKIISQDIINSISAKFVGVHPSLLPELRGATPIQSALLVDKKQTGVSLFILDEEVDHGPIISQKTLAIAKDDNYLSLEKKLAELGAEMLVADMPRFIKNEIKPIEQNHALATFTKKFKTEDGLVDLNKNLPEIIYHKIKALNPEPGVYAFINGIRTKLLDARISDNKIYITEIQEAGKLPHQVLIEISPMLSK